MTSDRELLIIYAENKGEEAFAELVRRHLNLVYSTALRRVNGDGALAQDVAQTVFADLARKAEALAGRSVLTGWLYTSTHFAATKAVRTENRRRAREQEAHTMQELFREPPSGPDWDKLRPVLDEAMHELKEADREAVLLRFFEKRPLIEVGARLGLSENAARMRVERALEKLRGHLARRGVTTAAAMSAVISANAVQMAPAGLAATLTTASLAGTATGTGTLAWLKIMNLTKLKLSLSAIVVASAATTLLVQSQVQNNLLAADRSIQQQAGQLAQLQMENKQLANPGRAGNAGQNSLDSLLRLRGEVESLRKQTNDLATAQAGRRGSRTQFAPQPGNSKTALQAREEGTAKMFYAKDWIIAFLAFADGHQGQCPTDFAQAAAFLPDQAKEETNVTADQFEIVYHGAMDKLTPEQVQNLIVLREIQPRQYPTGAWVKVYAFADGHCLVHQVASATDFDAWEQPHLVAPVNQ